MSKTTLFSLLFFLFSFMNSSWGQNNTDKQNESLSYSECINAYKILDQQADFAKLIEVGQTDIGKPLHLFVINSQKEFNLNKFDQSKAILLINNAIHPGEPCGIDASIRLADSLINNEKYHQLLKNTIVCIIPVYNIGGALNRSCCSRANQNGPEEYGFRGNAKNLDLNRDFIKMDSKNAKSFTSLFQKIKPHIFIDTHTSNGADYQYTMTLISTQPDKLEPSLGKFFKKNVIPEVYSKMDDKNWGMIPYVYTRGKTPDSGIKDFLETPRYSTGYAALFNTLGFTSETHMFKPFADRVESTFQFELSVLEFLKDNYEIIIKQKAKADLAIKNQKYFTLTWKLDTLNFETIPFKGFQSAYLKSDLSGKKRLFYDREKPITFPVKYFNRYIPDVQIEAPDYYILPQGWSEIIDRLESNNVIMKKIPHDIILTVESFHVINYKSSTSPYEGHYLHYNPKIEISKDEIQFHSGDIMIPVNQTRNRYIVETLEPQGTDSFFAWNFFDSCLQQKEWFSDYVFEEKAIELLANDSILKDLFEKKKLNNNEFNNNHWNQLYWIYKHSGYYESTANRLPVFRYNKLF